MRIDFGHRYCTLILCARAHRSSGSAFGTATVL
jgi:hypothetical protein